MILKYDIEVPNQTIMLALKKITNQIYKLLPMREEGEDWETPLKSILIELKGLGRLCESISFITLISKLEGLYTLINKDDFLLYRSTIFNCLSILSSLSEEFVKKEK